jgi:hypothetical protein
LSAPKNWIEKRVQWIYPRAERGEYPQPPQGQPYILFAACILPGFRDNVLQLGQLPRGYGQFLIMCTPHKIMAAESVHKMRNSNFKNAVAKKAAGMLPIGRDVVESRLREKKATDYFDFETAVATQEHRAQTLARILSGWEAELMESMEQLDAHPGLRVEVLA